LVEEPWVLGHGDTAILIKGSTIKAEYYWWKREIETYQAIRDWLRNHGFESWKKYHMFYLHAVFKRRERLRHYYRTAVRFLAKTLHGTDSSHGKSTTCFTYMRFLRGGRD